MAIGKDGHISREYVLRNFLQGYNILKFKFVYISILFLAFFLKKLAYKSMNLWLDIFYMEITFEIQMLFIFPSYFWLSFLKQLVYKSMNPLSKKTCTNLT